VTASAATSDRDPVRHLLTLAVFAPIGVVSTIREELPGALAAGRERLNGQLQVAKLLGQMAVRQLSGEVARRLDRTDAGEARARAVPTVTLEAPPSTTMRSDSLPEAILAAVDADIRAGIDADDDIDPTTLPIAGYESLAASQVVLRLGSLTTEELARIEAYEASHRARRTILGKIHQLRG
jgi:hypothetical protein